MSELLRAKHLSFSYGGVPALAEVNLSLSAGKIVAIIGPNGGGKSTLLRALLGYLPATGDIQWQGRALGAWRRRELGRLVAYLPQSPTWQATQTVVDALAVGRAPYWGPLGLESAGDQRAVLAVAATLELTDLLDRRMDDLSGGQRQTVLLGRCLVQQPRAMLLDEPDTFLDLKHQMDLRRLLSGLARGQSMGVLMASHDLNLAASFADEVIVLSEGRVATAGTPDQVLQPGLLEKVYGVAMDRLERAGGRAVLAPRI